MSELMDKVTRLCESLLEHTDDLDTRLREECVLAGEILELAEIGQGRDELTALARLAGERAGWPIEFAAIRVEMYKISRDAGVPPATRTQAGEAPESWLIIRALTEFLEEQGKLEAKK